MSKQPQRNIPRLAYTPMECIATGAVSSRTKLYELIARGELHSFREGKRRLITAASLEQYVRRKALEAAA